MEYLTYSFKSVLKYKIMFLPLRWQIAATTGCQEIERGDTSNKSGPILQTSIRGPIKHHLLFIFHFYTALSITFFSQSYRLTLLLLGPHGIEWPFPPPPSTGCIYKFIHISKQTFKDSMIQLVLWN